MRDRDHDTSDAAAAHAYRTLAELPPVTFDQIVLTKEQVAQVEGDATLFTFRRDKVSAVWLADRSAAARGPRDVVWGVMLVLFAVGYLLVGAIDVTAIATAAVCGGLGVLMLAWGLRTATFLGLTVTTGNVMLSFGKKLGPAQRKEVLGELEALGYPVVGSDGD